MRHASCSRPRFYSTPVLFSSRSLLILPLLCCSLGLLSFLILLSFVAVLKFIPPLPIPQVAIPPLRLLRPHAQHPTCLLTDRYPNTHPSPALDSSLPQRCPAIPSFVSSYEPTPFYRPTPSLAKVCPRCYNATTHIPAKLRGIVLCLHFLRLVCITNKSRLSAFP